MAFFNSFRVWPDEGRRFFFSYFPLFLDLSFSLFVAVSKLLFKLKLSNFSQELGTRKFTFTEQWALHFFARIYWRSRNLTQFAKQNENRISIFFVKWKQEAQIKTKHRKSNCDFSKTSKVKKCIEKTMEIAIYKSLSMPFWIFPLSAFPP